MQKFSIVSAAGSKLLSEATIGKAKEQGESSGEYRAGSSFLQMSV